MNKTIAIDCIAGKHFHTMLIAKLYPEGSTCTARFGAKTIEAEGTAADLEAAYHQQLPRLRRSVQRITLYREIGSRERIGGYTFQRLRLDHEADLSSLDYEGRAKALLDAFHRLAVPYRLTTIFRVRLELE